MKALNEQNQVEPLHFGRNCSDLPLFFPTSAKNKNCESKSKIVKQKKKKNQPNTRIEDWCVTLNFQYLL